MTITMPKPDDERRRANLRLALILASLAAALALGFVLKTWLLGG